MSSGDKEAEASEDLAEDTSTSRCTEANTSADRVSLPVSSDDDELVILFDGHILDVIMRNSPTQRHPKIQPMIPSSKHQ